MEEFWLGTLYSNGRFIYDAKKVTMVATIATEAPNMNAERGATVGAKQAYLPLFVSQSPEDFKVVLLIYLIYKWWNLFLF
jgi:hypothetical protein